MPPLPQQSRECQCPRARHQHGTRRAYERDRCRCLRCRAAHANAVRAYRNGGTWREAYVDAAETKRLLRALVAAGVTSRRVAAHTGLSIDMLSYLRAGKQRNVTPELAAVVADAFAALWHTGRATPDARRCMTQGRTAGYLPPFAWDDGDEELQPCGTHAAFARHKSRGEPVDVACAAGERAYQAERARRNRRLARDHAALAEVAS
jgi:hypothetical protein